MSKVPKLKRSEAADIGELVEEGRHLEAIEEKVVHLEEELFDFTALEEVIEEISKGLKSGEDPRFLELKYSGEVYLSLKKLKAELRDDWDVWRGITAKYFIELAVARTSNHATSKWEILGAGSNTREILARRMFGRGQLCYKINEEGDVSFPYLKGTGLQSHDFWMSHVLGMDTGSEKGFGCALVKQQGENRLSTEDLRPLVRDSVNRPKRTLATFLMTEEEANDFLQPIFENYST